MEKAKSSFGGVQLGSKYVSASGSCWLKKLVVGKKFKKLLTLIWTRQKKFVLVLRGVFRTQSNTYDRTFIRK